jgi:hypothetical protein
MAGGDASPQRSRSSKQQRKATSLPTETIEYLKAWMMSPDHIAHPYPTETEKSQIMKDTGIEVKQLTNWFVNNRKRFWKPRVEARLRDPQQAPLIKPDGSPLTLEDVTGDGPATGGNGHHQMGSSSSSSSIQQLDRTPKRRSSRRNASSAASPVVVSPPRSISEDNSVVSSYSTSSDEEDDVPPVTTTTKTVKVHILRPAICSIGDDLPELADVSVSEGTLFVPKNRILRTFDNCALTYGDEGTLESEVERIKKHYLGIYIAERIMSVVRVSDDDDDDDSSAGDVRRLTTTCKKRKVAPAIETFSPPPPSATATIITPLSPTTTMLSTPRPKKILCCSKDDWKLACWSAYNCYDDEALPSLEEASSCFGL